MGEANSAVKLEEEGYSQGMETAVEAPTRSLSATERCDACGAQAYLAAEVAGTELLFCAHHAKQNREKLSEVGIITIDETSKLVS